jgi:hypothetical protein
VPAPVGSGRGYIYTIPQLLGNPRSGRSETGERMSIGSAPEATPSSGGAPTPSSPPRARVPAVLFGPDDDLRRFLRGLLLLHRHPVALEARSPDEVVNLPGSPEPRLLVFDAGPAEGAWRDDLVALLRARPELRTVVLLPKGGERLRPEVERLGGRAMLVRPFGVDDLLRAIDEALAEPPTSS